MTEQALPIKPFIVHAMLKNPVIALPTGVEPPQYHRCEIFLVAATSADDARHLLGMTCDDYEFVDVFGIEDLLDSTKKKLTKHPA